MRLRHRDAGRADTALRATAPEPAVLTEGNIPVMALTALAGDGDRARALAAGFQMHLVKPVDIDRLRQAVVNLVAGPPSAPRVPPLASGVRGFT
jgi:CheY-like chemotaxis protein